jgi:hypothetical protein
VPEARARGYEPGRFSFNVKGGRCEACQGDGVIKVEMHFLPDVYVPCDICKGKRYNRETLEIRYKGKNDRRSARDDGRGGAEFFRAVPVVAQSCRRCWTSAWVHPPRPERDDAVGRRGAAREAREGAVEARDRPHALHPRRADHRPALRDIELLLGVLQRLRDEGNTVVVIEHNLDVIKTADWIVDLGPEGGDGGGAAAGARREARTGPPEVRVSGAAVALATTPEAHPLDEDWGPLSDALRERGYAVDAPDWEDASVDWGRYALVLPRATWNYVDRLPAFLAWTERVAGTSRLENDPSTIRWNTDKRYLLDLERGGAPIIPTWVTPPDGTWSAPPVPEYVVKPAVGAGSRGARRFRADQAEHAGAHAARLQREGANVITQPYLASVDDAGETALVYLGGRYSHAIRKSAILEREGDDGGLFDPGRVAGLFAPERITPRAAARDELAVGERVLSAVTKRLGRAPLYARVDLIRDDTGAPRVLELELTEPSLFFRHAPGSAARLADAIGTIL